MHYIFLFFSLILGACQPSRQKEDFATPATLDTLRSEPATSGPPLHRHRKRSQKQAQAEPIPAHLKQLVSVSIGENLPLKTALLTLAQSHQIDIQLDSAIDRKILFSAHQKPFIDVIKDICDLAELRFSIKGQAIRIEVDTPFPQNYNIQHLNLVRSTDNHTSIATDVFSNGTEFNGPTDNGSNSNVTAKMESNFWSELDSNLKVILGDTSLFTLHRQGGIITVRGTAKQHRAVTAYLNSLRRATATQVLIEAKVIEVNLKDEFKAGINWQQLTGRIRADIPLGKIAQEGKITAPMHVHQDILNFGVNTGDFSSILQAIQQFGATNTISSPRLTVLNNQSAILKVAQNQVYFRLRYDKQYNLIGNRESINVASDIQTVPIGLVMAVQPSIDDDTGEIILSLRPTISRLNRSIADPAIDIAYRASGGRGDSPKPSLVPVVEVREIDSVLRVKSGKIAILGGLMESRQSLENTKVPWLGDVWGVGKLASSKSETDEVVELVILLRATILEGDEDLNPADQRLADEYASDARPF
jgi:MSHA type pilus biogenesis protein MshL